ncbi:MAG: EAL domain-containing protein [Chitinophagales bacterium]
MDDYLQPQQDSSEEKEPELRLDRLIDLETLQAMQDAFAQATGVASIITHPDGRPITRASNFCRLCSEIIRKTPQRLANCMISDAVIGRPNPEGPIIQHCLSGGLWDGGASITVGDRHIANWLIGQVLDQSVDLDRMMAYAREIGADEAEFQAALAEVTRMPKQQFDDICRALFLIAQQISSLAYKNAALLHEVEERRRVEEELREANEELSAANEEIIASDEELRRNFDVLQRTESELRESESRFREMLANAEFCAVILDGEGRVLFCNEFLLELSGWSETELLGRNWFDLLAPPEQRDELEAGFHEFFRQERSDSHVTYELVTRRGERRTIAWNRTRLRDALGGIKAVTSIGEDMTDRLKNERAIHYLAYYDQLTGLPNRSLFYDRAAQAIAHARRSGEHLGVLFIDLDFFKTVNDTMGHNTGDQMLRAVGERMREAIRSEDTLARTGGDEFVALIQSGDGTESVARSAQRLLDALQPPFVLREQEYQVTASIGIAVYPTDGQDVVTLLQHADMAMYWAKENGRNRYQFFTPSMNDFVHQRNQLEKDLRRALAHGEFELHYQPVCETRGGRVVGLEALLRWRHPQRGLVPPGEFIPLAEETGLIGPVGEWVVGAVGAQVREWRDRGIRPRRVSVNLSGKQFQQAGLVDRITSLLEKHGLSVSALGFEVTEGVTLQDAASTISTLRTLRERGGRVSLDDFGTGYSALSYLGSLPLDILKLDKSFIHGLGKDESSAAVASSVIFLAHQLGLKVVAEGVETAEQLEFLRRERCDFIQGYLASRPLPAAQLEEILRRGAVALPQP